MRPSLLTYLLFTLSPISNLSSEKNAVDFCQQKIDELSELITHKQEWDNYEGWYFLGQMMAYEEVLEYLDRND